MNDDTIEIRGLRLSVRIGVPDEERALRQCVEADLILVPRISFDTMGDDLARTVDYQAVAQHIRQLCEKREWRLLEAMGSEIAGEVLDRFALREITLEIRKFILPGTHCVAVRLTRSAPQG